MKKLLLLTLMLLTFGMGGFAQSEYDMASVGSSTSASYYGSGFAGWYGWHIQTAMYTANEMPDLVTGSSIEALSWNFGTSTSTTSGGTVKIWLTELSDNGIAGTTSYSGLKQNATLVYTGTCTAVGGQWWYLPLANSYTYNGGNLVVIIESTGCTTSGGCTKYLYATDEGTSSTLSWTFFKDSSPLDTTQTLSGLSNTNTNSNKHYRPDIRVYFTPGNVSCHPVGSLSVSNIQSNDALLTWGTPEDGGTYLLQYKAAGQAWGGGNVTTTTLTDTTFDFSGALTPVTTYNVRVANYCGAGDTSTWRSTTFTTACSEIATLPYMDGFDTYGTGESAYPDCWEKINTYSGYNRPYVNSTHYDGTGSLYFYATSTTYNIAITPAFDASIDISTLQADFMYRANSSSDRLIVGVMTDFTDASTFVPVDTVMPGSTATAWVNRTVNFSNYTGNGHYIAFMNRNTSNNAYAYLDNLAIDLIPSCQKPDAVTLSNVTAEGCDVNWTPVGSESAWEITAVPHDADVSSGTPEAISYYPYTLTGLSDDTQYDVYVRANCGGDYSAWTFRVSFTTNPLCTSPLNVNVSQVMGTSAMVTWNSALYGATGYTVGYSEAGQDNWTTQSVTGNSLMLSGLNPSTDYDVFVLSECDAGDADSVFASFSTHCLAGGDPFTDGDISTYYIPVNNYYNYTYSQQIFLASEMGGPQTIDSIAFEYGYSTASTQKTNVTIYLGHTTQSTFSSTSNYISNAGLQQVYSGNLNCSQGWNTFVFSTPFQYNGTDNLVLVVDDNSGAYNNSSYTFRAHNAGAVRTVYYYSDSYNMNPSNPTSDYPNSSTSSNRSNVKFFNACDNTVTCIAPNPYVTGTTDNSVTIAWAPGNTEGSWEVESSTDNMTWTAEGTATTPGYTVSNLAANTSYLIRIRSLCGGGESSNWVMVSARTECSSVGIPYTEDFESAPGSGSGNMVFCWTTGSNYTSSHYPYTSSNQHHDGSYSAYFYGSGSYYSYLASPAFDESVNMSDLQVRFWARKASANYYIQVGVMTDPNDPGTFVQVGQNITPDTINTWQLREVNTDSYTGSGRHIAFRIPQDITNYMYVDDITIDVIPTCAHVESLAASNITTDAADISWTAGGNESEWALVYGPAGTISDPDAASAIIVSGTPSFNLSGLSASTAYDVFVKAVCSATDGSIWWQGTFKTLCGEISVLPLMENFDNMGSGTAVYPDCWLRHNNYSSSTNYPYVSTNYHASGNASLYFYCSSSTYNYAVLPAMDVNTYPINTLQVSFKMRSTSSATSSSIQVGVMTDSSDVSTFVSVQEVHNTTTGVFEEFEVPLTNYTGSGRFIALKLVNTSNTYSIYMDDLMVDLTPLCDKPTNVIASNITASGADINWMPGGQETSWEMVAVPSGQQITAGTPETVTEHPYTLTGLNDNTAYDVYVRADCGTGVDFSSWSPVCSFTTTPLCSAPTDVTVSQVAGTSALVSWTPAIFGATAYTVAYTETGMNSWSTQSVVGNQLMLTGLTPETAYTLTVTSECEQGTAPVVTKTFATPCLYSGSTQVGNGNSGSYHIPLNTYYNYSYTQQLYLANEVNTSGEINSIAFQYIYSTPQTKSNQSIYLAETDLTTLNDWIPLDSLTLVYSGTVTYNNSGTDNWLTIPFNTPFNYSGNRNLVVVVKNNDGDYTTSNSNTFNTHSATGKTLEYYNDDDAFSFSNPESASSYSYRNNIRFGLACDPTVTCIAPNVYIADATETTLTVDWVPGNNESSWELEVSADDTTWVSEGTVTSSPYTITNLLSGTAYTVRMRSDCGGEYSNWSMAYGTTACALISTLPFTEDFDSHPGSTATSVSVNNLPYCWSYHNEGTSSSYSGYPIIYTSASYAASGSNSLRFYTYTPTNTYDDQTAILPAIDVNTLPMNTLQVSFDARALSTSYPFNLEIGVMTDPTDINTFMTISTISTQVTTYNNYEVLFNQYTGAGAYIAIRAPKPTSNYNYGYVDNIKVDLIPSCLKPTQLNVVSTTTSSVELGWTESGTATSWVVEYGQPGFTPGTGTVVDAPTNPYTVDNLTPATVYDFYVRAVCDAGDSSLSSNAITVATGCNAIDQLPYTENFDGVSGTTSTSVSVNNLPVCWNYLNTGTSTSYSGYPIVYKSSTYAASDSNALRFYCYTTSGTYDDQMAILPEIDVNTYPMNTLQVSFDARNNSSYTFTVVVGVISNPSDKSTFTPLDTMVTTSGTYANYEFPLSQYTGSGRYIALMAPRPSSSYNAGYVDNIEVGFIPSCPKPHNLHAVDVTTNSVELGWTEMGSATSWEIAYGAPGFDPDGAAANIVTANTNPFTVQNLNSSTNYEFYVRSLCSSTDVSYWSSNLEVATTMTPVALPYTADFSTNDAWVLNNGACTNYWMKGTVGNDPALFVTNNGSTPEYSNSISAVAALKLFTVGTADSITITFDIMVDGESSYDYFKLFLAPSSQQFPAVTSVPSDHFGDNTYSTNAYNFYANGYGTQSSYPYLLNKLTATTHVVATMPNPNTNPNANSTALLALTWKNDGSVLYNPPATITNLSVTTDGSGPVQTNPTVATNAATAVAQTTATLNGTITNPDNVTISAKGFEWKTTTGGTYQTVNATGSGLSYNLTGLTANTGYTFRAFITFNGNTVYGDEMTFTTLEQGVEPCDVPTGVTATNITGEGATITWDANANVSSWNIQYGPQGGQLTSATTSTNSYVITGLTPSTTYNVQVQAVCDGNNASDWSAIYSFTTTTGIHGWLENSVKVFPNPANDFVNVQCTMYNVQMSADLHVFDVYGKLVQTVPMTGETTAINVSSLADGMYFVRVTTEAGTVTKPFVVKR